VIAYRKGDPGGRVALEDRRAGSHTLWADEKVRIATHDDKFPLPDLEGVPRPDDLEPVGVATGPSAASQTPMSRDDPAVVTDQTQPFVRPLPRLIALANQKGGVGKTTTAVNLGACMAELGYRTLIVDLDPQGNASTGLGINIRDLQTSMYDVMLHDVAIDDCVEATALRNLFVAPASLDLAGAEIELVPAFSRELRVRRALDDVRDDYDFIFIDCPPSLGLLTINGLAAATEVMVPVQCEYYALEGLGQLLRNVQLVQRNLNPVLELSAMLLVMYDARTKLAEQVVQELREHFGPKVCRTIVPRTVRLSEAPSFGQPIITFDPSSRGSIAYRNLALEVSGGAA
jgi:chromosome partitioning protein